MQVFFFFVATGYPVANSERCTVFFSFVFSYVAYLFLYSFYFILLLLLLYYYCLFFFLATTTKYVLKIIICYAAKYVHHKYYISLSEKAHSRFCDIQKRENHLFLHWKIHFEKKTARFNGLLEHLKAKNAPVEITNRFFVMGGGDILLIFLVEDGKLPVEVTDCFFVMGNGCFCVCVW